MADLICNEKLNYNDTMQQASSLDHSGKEQPEKIISSQKIYIDEQNSLELDS